MSYRLSSKVAVVLSSVAVGIFPLLVAPELAQAKEGAQRIADREAIKKLKRQRAALGKQVLLMGRELRSLKDAAKPLDSKEIAKPTEKDAGSMGGGVAATTSCNDSAKLVLRYSTGEEWRRNVHYAGFSSRAWGGDGTRQFAMVRIINEGAAAAPLSVSQVVDPTREVAGDLPGQSVATGEAVPHYFTSYSRFMRLVLDHDANLPAACAASFASEDPVAHCLAAVNAAGGLQPNQVVPVGIVMDQASINSYVAQHGDAGRVVGTHGQFYDIALGIRGGACFEEKQIGTIFNQGVLDAAL